MSLSSKALIYKKFELASLIKGYGGPGKAMFVNCEELGILLIRNNKVFKNNN